MPKVYHAIVIGAGPAGLNAARFLQDDCLVIDKKKELGLPVQCGEGISLHALERENLDLQSDWIATNITQIKRIMPNGMHWGNKRDEPYAFVLYRDKFEKYLAGLVSCEICLDTRVVKLQRENAVWKLTTSQNKIYWADYIIGADGPLSMVARSVYGYKYRLIPGINYEVHFKQPVLMEELRMYFGNDIAPKGYGWIFPCSEYSVNVGLLIKTEDKVRKYYDNFLTRIVEPLYGDFNLGRQKSGALPISGFPKIVAKENTFLVGDAGAFTDPIFSGGMSLALLTGRLAAESINNGNVRQYQAEIDNLPFTGQELLKAQEIFYGFDDATLSQLGEVLHDKSTSYINTEEGQRAVMSKSKIKKHLRNIAEFAKTWQAAKAFLW
jgi:digeranylgeranylglycerophospholipid reductase